jgi:hypothetical protein
VQPLADNGEQHCLREAERGHHHGGRDRQLAQGNGAGDVAGARGQLGEPALPGRRRAVLGDPDGQQGGDGDQEGSRVADDHRSRAEDGEQSRARQRRHQPEPLLRGLQHAVRIAQQVSGDDGLHERGLRGTQHAS